MPLIGLQQGLAGLGYKAPVAGGGGGTGGSSLIRGRPILRNGTVMSDIGTLLRGVTMALDFPGSVATAYTVNRANWQFYRDLKFNLVRLPFSIEYEGTTVAAQLPDMDRVVANASATGMYVMFLLDGAYGVANYGEFHRVWPTICARYRNNTNVFFEMNNEPHWGMNEFGSGELDEVASVYNEMHAAAPDTLIGVFTPAAMENAGDAIFCCDELRARGVTFGPAFLSWHAYGNYTRNTTNAVKARYPLLMTETVWTGGGTLDEVYKIPEMEALQCSWCTLHTRWGEVSNVDTPFSADQTSLTDRVLPDVHAQGVDWPQDALTSTALNARPAGRIYTGMSGFSPGVGRAGAPGSIPGRVFAVTINFTRGNVTVAGGGGLPKSITLTPQSPGTLTRTSPTAGASWNTTVTVQNITSVTWAIIQSNGVQRGSATVIPAVNTNPVISAVFQNSGEFVRVWETGNTAVNRDSGAVTLVTTPSRSITLNPQNPGTISTPGIVPIQITTSGITNVSWVVVNNNATFSWDHTAVATSVNVNGSTITANANFRLNDQFILVFDTNDTSFYVDGGHIVITNANSGGGGGGTPGGGGGGLPTGSPTFFEGFDNNNGGQLNHTWGNRSAVSYSNGICRIEGLPGGTPDSVAAGVMQFPGGMDWGFGYGLYELHTLFSDIGIGNGSGSANVLWPAGDGWPGPEIDLGEVSRDGRFYHALHWNDNGNDAFELHILDNHDWWNWHTNACLLEYNRCTFYVDGVVIGVSEGSHVTPAYVDGGENRVIGIMNRDNESWMECDWVAFTAI